jgi:hypothetical protein
MELALGDKVGRGRGILLEALVGQPAASQSEITNAREEIRMRCGERGNETLDRLLLAGGYAEYPATAEHREVFPRAIPVYASHAHDGQLVLYTWSNHACIYGPSQLI